MPKELPRRVTVKFEHLQLPVQRIVKPSKHDDRYDNISDARKIRFLIGDSLLVGGFALAHAAPELPSSYIATTATGAVSRTIAVQFIQYLHSCLLNVIKLHGVLQTQYEHLYAPKGFMQNWIEKNHPIFYVKANGNLVFLRESPAEYKKYKFQKTRAGKAGLHPWRYRVYLRPPKTPEKAPVKQRIAAFTRLLAKT